MQNLICLLVVFADQVFIDLTFFGIFVCGPLQSFVVNVCTLKRIEKIIRESAFDKKTKKAGLKFNPGLALTGVRTTGPRELARGSGK